MTESLLITTGTELTLRQLTLHDAPAYFEAVNASREHLSQFDDETAEKYPTLKSVEDSIENPPDITKLRFGIWAGNVFVGSINAKPDEHGAEIGYWLDVRHTGQGYATEALKAISGYAIEHVGSPHAWVKSGNDRSVAVLERAGYVHTYDLNEKLIFYLPNPEFDSQLEQAFRHPLELTLEERKGISPEEITERTNYYEQQTKLPDEALTVYVGVHTAKSYEVTTDEPEQYALLIAQAMRQLEIAKGNPDPGVKVTSEISKSATHEITHGKMGEALGVKSIYGVRVLHDPANNIWAIGPSHILVGPAQLTKLESAAISVAPEDASDGDMLSVRAAGYTDREDVLNRLYSRRPDLQPAAVS